MTQISNEGDATVLNQRFDRRFHNRSELLERLARNIFSKDVSTASLSIPGSHCSDVAMLSECLLQSPKSPEVVIWGVAPRDFMDNSLLAPSSTTTFHLMEKLNPPDSMEYAGRIHWQDRLMLASNKLLHAMFPTYCFQEELSLRWRRFVRAEMQEHLATSDQEILSPDENKKLVINSGPEECTVPRYSCPATDSEPTSDISECYRCVYNPFNESTYLVQLNFLRAFLNTCKSRNIHALLVNMPLRSDSFGLMPPGLYDRYMRDIATLSKESGASFADLNDEHLFRSSDFIDQVHLSGRAVPKFLSALSNYLPACLEGCSQSNIRQLGMSPKNQPGAM
jgi:hypothetical protein